MTTVDFGRYKRIMQYFWDPAPTNVGGSRIPIWCLGRKYVIAPGSDGTSRSQASLVDASAGGIDTRQSIHATTPPDSMTSSFDSDLAYDETTRTDEDGDWPKSFLDDFEAKIWLTYRSNFPTIPRSQDPQVLTTMTFSARLRSQLIDQSGFTSDTGWGCMIRSGQSLLANALLFLRLGRGTEYSTSHHFTLTMP
jgi:cysteine protease ATG4